MSVDLNKLPLGESGFTLIRKTGMVYVDKTDLIYLLAGKYSPIFLSRPRRFGKSLLVSAFESLFSKGLEDFKGLKIEKLWKEEKTYPVIHLDCAGISGNNLKEITLSFDNKLRAAAEIAGFIYDSSPSALPLLNQFGNWLKRRSLDYDLVVLLVDEYDAPLTKLLNNPTLFEDVRKYLAAFYGLIKEHKGAFRFVFATGIAKFQKASIFSEMNAFTDISMDIKYGTLLGYTQEELEKYFSPYIDNAAEILKMSRAELLAKLKEQYDGFCFDEVAKYRLYAPWSVLSFFTSPHRGFRNYWMSTGARPSILLEYAKGRKLLKPEEFGKKQKISIEKLSDAYDYDNIQPIPLLTQTGYYTIDSVDSGTATLRYPNEEVYKSMGRVCTQVIFNDDDEKVTQVNEIVAAAKSGAFRKMITAINKAFVNIPKKTKNAVTNEEEVQSHMMMFLAGAELNEIGEKANAIGRSDLVIYAEDYVYVMEFKFLRDKGKKSTSSADTLLEAAVKQIITKEYGIEYSGNKLMRLAMVFSEDKQRFIKWKRVPLKASL